MSGVVAGFTVIFVVIGVGYVLARFRVLGDQGERVLSTLVFYVATPALLFDLLARADLSVLTSPVVQVTSISALLVAALYLAVARLWLRRAVPDAVIGALAASYVNASNLGIPIAVYVLGDASYVAPLLLFQIMIYSPIALTTLDISTAATQSSLRESITAPFRNPILLAGASGLVVSATDWTVPEPIAEPIRLLAGMSVPGALLAFGLSLHGARVLARGAGPRRDVALASVGKMVVLPAVALTLAHFGWGLRGHQLFAAAVISCLPTAQNVFIYASRYGRSTVLARDTAFITTIASIPALTVASLLFS